MLAALYMVFWCPSLDVLLLLTGLGGLWLATEFTLRGAISIAARWGMQEFIVGAAILSVGSDLPEFGIAVLGSVDILRHGEASDVVVGSALGSAIGQIGFVAGVTGLFGYLTLPKGVVFRHGCVLLGSLIVLALVGIDGEVSRTEGGLLLVLYAIYFTTLLTGKTELSEKPPRSSPLPALQSWIYLCIGLLTVAASAELTVNSATSVATALNIPESFIAVIIIGLGTSLPELSISLGAILRRRASLSVGNLIGSNIFDTLVPIGAAGAISTLRFDGHMLSVDLPFLFALSALALIFFARTKGLQKYEAATLLVAYFGYATIKFAAI